MEFSWRTLGIPLGGRKRAHRQRVDFLAHAVAEGRVDQLVALDAALAVESGGDDQRLEMLAVANDLDALGGELRFDSGLDAFGRNHQWRSLYPVASIHSAPAETSAKLTASTPRLSAGGTSDTPKK